MFSLEQLVRPNIWKLAPYSSARDEYSGHEAHVFLDANENPYNAPYNRYPDPLQRELKSVLKKVKGVPEDMIFLGNGSDEAIDLAYRVFCNPGIDNVVAIAPSYGMYKVCADINDIEYRTVLLDEHYQFSADKLLAACDAHTKIIWLCSPNNPTGNSLDRDEMLKVVNQFQGIVIIDEAYIDFAQQLSMRQELPTHPNLIILQTMSKAWGSAAIRLGMAFASKDIIAIYNKVKYPYNVNLYRTAYRAGSVPHRCQLLSGSHDRCSGHLRLSGQRGHHCAQSHPCTTVPELLAHHHWQSFGKQRTDRSPAEILDGTTLES